MQIQWRRWEPTHDHDASSPDIALAQAIDKSLDIGNPKDSFEELWRYWWRTFPDACVLATLTQKCGKERQQLRLWFEEPSSYSAEHVNSNGFGLIVTILGGSDELKQLLRSMLPRERFKEERQEEHNVLIWRRMNE